MNHPFYIDSDLYRDYTGSPKIWDLDEICSLICNIESDEGEWTITARWKGPKMDNDLRPACAFNSESNRNKCFRDMKDAIFTARKIDEEIP